MKLLLASHNFGKVKEFKELFKALDFIELMSLNDFPSYLPPEETGVTFKENAVLKAQHAANALNVWTLADDSGLSVPILENRPGVYSARYRGIDATDQENCNQLLTELLPYPTSEQRVAYYECCLVICSPTEVKKCVEACCAGEIALAAKGNHGFGYDPLFIKNEYGKTFGELDPSVKKRVSHRAKAVEKLIPFLESLRE